MSMDKVQFFLNEVEKLKSTYASMETVILAGNDGEQWANLGTIIWLSHKKVDEKKEEVLFRLNDQLIVLHRVEEFSSEIFRDISLNLNKVMKFQEFEVVSKDLSFYYIKEEKENWTRERISDREGWPAHILISGGKNSSELLKNKIDEINKNLQANVEPYEDINDLSSKYLFPVGGAYSSGIYVVAPIYIRMEKSNLTRNGTLDILIKYHKTVEVNALKMNIIWASASANIDRFQLLFKQKGDLEDDFYIIHESLERKLDNVTGTRIYLFYKDSLIRRDWIPRTKPQSEGELKKDILGAIQELKDSVSNIEKVLEEIDIAALSGVIDVQDNVKDKSVWNDLGIYCLENGFYRQAELVYRRMIETITEYEKAANTTLHKGLAFYNLGISLLYLSEKEEARRLLVQAYEEDKKSFGIENAERMLARETLRKVFNE